MFGQEVPFRQTCLKGGGWIATFPKKISGYNRVGCYNKASWRDPKRKPKAASGNLIQVTHKYLAYPTDLQTYRMENWMGSLCHLSNASIAERKDAYRSTGKGLTYTDQQNALPDKRKSDPALRMVHSQVCQDCLQRVDKAYQKFYEDIKRKKSG